MWHSLPPAFLQTLFCIQRCGQGVSASGTQRKMCTDLVYAGGIGRCSYLPDPVLFLCIVINIIQSLEMI